MSSSVVKSRVLRRKPNAQGLVEFALIFPVLMMLLFGAIDMGWMIFNYGQLFNGVREGLRYGSVTGYGGTKQYLDCSGIKGRVKAYAGYSGVKDTDITIYYDDGNPGYSSPPTCTGTAPAGFTNGWRVRIVVSVNVPFLSPFFRAMFSSMNITQNGARSVSQLS